MLPSFGSERILAQACNQLDYVLTKAVEFLMVGEHECSPAFYAIFRRDSALYRVGHWTLLAGVGRQGAHASVIACSVCLQLIIAVRPLKNVGG